MKKLVALLVITFFFVGLHAQVKKEIAIPDILGYKTLKTDLHVHTVFSDGQVWPTTRIEEAYREGLDAIAITDHLEYRPFKSDIPASHNRSYEIAKPEASKKGIILIKGTEITKSKMPPGHFNALFINDADKMDNEDYMVQLKEGKSQNGFIFWNHPGWRAQQKETVWWDVHTEIYDQGLMQGIEVVNNDDYYPEAHQWALDKKLTMLCNTDIHPPVNLKFDLVKGHRPMTLVFAKERSEAGIREALEARRTAAYFKDIVVAESMYLKAIFEASVEVVEVERKGNTVKVTLLNKSDLPFHIKNVSAYFRCKDFTIPAMSKISVEAMVAADANASTVSFEIANLYAAPNEGLEYQYNF